MEKGAAKFYGRYENMDGGFTSESLYAMTGMPTVDWTHSKTTETELWNILDGYDKKHYIMTAGCVDVGADPVTGLKKDYLGLPTGHAYTVKGVKEYNGNKYVQIRNPWGAEEYRGPSSDKDTKFWTPEALTTLGHKVQDDGIFWMPLKVYKDLFLDVTTALYQDWHKQSKKYSWNRSKPTSSVLMKI
jgi:hypothetical protein